VWNWFSTGQGTGASGGGFSTNFSFAGLAAGLSQFQQPCFAPIPQLPGRCVDSRQHLHYRGKRPLRARHWRHERRRAALGAFMAMVNEQGKENGHAPIGFANPALYALGQSALYESLFHDITVGDNTNATSGPIDFPAVPGYDLATGLGTPTPALLDALAPPVGPILRPILNVLSGGNGNGQIDPNECNDLTVTITNAGPVRATGVEGVLVSGSYPAIVISQSIAPFPDVPPFSSVTATVPFEISSSPDFACGSPVQLSLTLKCDQDTSESPIVFGFGARLARRWHFRPTRRSQFRSPSTPPALLRA